MELTDLDHQLIALLSEGLPVSPRPYWVLAAALGWEEEEVLARLHALKDGGVIRRMGVIVRHLELGYRANGMVVWDVPDERIATVAPRLAADPRVTLCYRRPRRPPDWPYNLFTMIHGTDRDAVRGAVEALAAREELADIPHEILFSTARYKQRGALYGSAKAPEDTGIGSAAP